MIVKIGLLYMIGWIQSQTVEAIDCYSCINSTLISVCSKPVPCPSDSVCYSEYTTSQGKRLYTLGCRPKQSCPVVSASVAPAMVGRATSVGDTCSECCTTGFCNRQLCQDKGDHCSDQKGYDCVTLGSVFNLCVDTKHSETYCRRFCGLCNTIDGGWTAWSEWSSCDVTCGNGTMTKSRTCSDPAPVNGGSDCSGPVQQQTKCVKSQCPVHGGWSLWSAWGICSVTCDVGLQRRDRSCSNPYPARYGDHCYGESRDDRLCFPGACANGSWSAWTNWGSCSATCDVGIKLRNRKCDNPPPSMTGIDCDGDPLETTTCTVKSCHDGNWSAWTPWSACSATCDGGLKLRTRKCDNPAPSITGTYCDGNSLETTTCAIKSCYVPVLFYAKTLSTTSPGSYALLRFTTVVSNIGHGYDSKTGVFTAPVNGTYTFDVNICVNPTQNVDIRVFKNNDDISNTFFYDRYYVCNSITVAAILKSGDKVMVKTGSGNSPGSSLYQDPRHTNTFRGVRVQ